MDGKIAGAVVIFQNDNEEFDQDVVVEVTEHDDDKEIIEIMFRAGKRNVYLKFNYDELALARRQFDGR